MSKAFAGFTSGSAAAKTVAVPQSATNHAQAMPVTDIRQTTPAPKAVSNLASGRFKKTMQSWLKYQEQIISRFSELVHVKLRLYFFLFIEWILCN